MIELIPMTLCHDNDFSSFVLCLFGGEPVGSFILVVDGVHDYCLVFHRTQLLILMSFLFFFSFLMVVHLVIFLALCPVHVHLEHPAHSRKKPHFIYSMSHCFKPRN